MPMTPEQKERRQRTTGVTDAELDQQRKLKDGICQGCLHADHKNIHKFNEEIYIYEISIGGKIVYVGQAHNCDKRMDEHIKEYSPLGDALRNNKSNRTFKNVLTLYTPESANRCENLLIQKRDTLDNGFNRKLNASGNLFGNVNILFCPLHKKWDMMCDEWKLDGIKDQMKLKHFILSDEFKDCEEVARIERLIKYAEWKRTPDGVAAIAKSKAVYDKLK